MTKTTKTQERKEIVVVPESPVAVEVFDPEKDIERATKAAKALMTVVNRTKPLQMGGKKYLYFEHWQTIGQFFKHTVGIEWTKPIEENGKVVGFEAKSTLYHKGMVVGGAEAACMDDEPNWKGKPKFQLRSMAQTRAMAKALRSRFGFIPVLVGLEATPAEEMPEARFEKPKPVPINAKELELKIAEYGKQLGIKVRSAKEWAEVIQDTTSLQFIPENYNQIAERLSVMVKEKEVK